MLDAGDAGAVLETVDRLVDRHLPLEALRRRDLARDPPYGLLPVLGEAGLIALAVPEAAGGLGAPWTLVAAVQARLGERAWMLASLYNRTVGFGAAGLLAYGSEAQRAEWLPRLLRGEALAALALSEPAAGSDAAAVETRAERVAGGWRLRGLKHWISDAEAADFMVVVARTGERRGALSLFLVPKGTAGVSFAPIPKIGNNCLPSFEVRLDCDLPEGALMGREGEGMAHLGATLHAARAGMAASVTGYAEFALGLIVAHLRERAQFGRPLGAHQALAHRAADLRMRVDLSRLAAEDLARRIEVGAPCARQAAQAKVVATETLQRVADEGMQMLASAAYHAESDMSRVWRDARLYSFGEGSNEIQRGIVAREMGLGR